jgi:hypothetical protein
MHFIFVMNILTLETRRPRGRPRNTWQDEVMEDGRMVGGDWKQEDHEVDQEIGGKMK